MKYVNYTPDDICLDLIFRLRFPNLKKFYRDRGRTAYSDRFGNKVYPLTGTIFELSPTPLSAWFQAIAIIVITDKKISVKEIQRHLGVTYKTAWRMHKLIIEALEGKQDFAFINKKAQEVNHGGVTFPGNRYVNADKTPKLQTV